MKVRNCNGAAYGTIEDEAKSALEKGIKEFNKLNPERWGE